MIKYCLTLTALFVLSLTVLQAAPSSQDPETRQGVELSQSCKDEGCADVTAKWWGITGAWDDCKICFKLRAYCDGASFVVIDECFGLTGSSGSMEYTYRYREDEHCVYQAEVCILCYDTDTDTWVEVACDSIWL